MSQLRRLKIVEKLVSPIETTISAKLPDWLQEPGYEPERTGRVIRPKGYQALQPDGSVKYETG